MGKEGYVSIQAVNDVFDAYKYLDGNDAIYRFKQWMDGQEPVRPMQKWVLVNDRIPEKDGMYICTIKFKHEDGCPDVETHAVEYIKAYGGWDMERFFSECNPRIIAWMPLPEPYNGGDAE